MITSVVRETWIEEPQHTALQFDNGTLKVKVDVVSCIISWKTDSLIPTILLSFACQKCHKEEKGEYHPPLLSTFHIGCSSCKESISLGRVNDLAYRMYERGRCYSRKELSTLKLAFNTDSVSLYQKFITKTY